MPITDDQVTKIFEKLDQLSMTLTEYTTVTKRHIVQQETQNTHVAKMLEKLDERVRKLETAHAVLENRIPTRLLDADQVIEKLRRHELAIDTINTSVQSIKITLVKWGSIATAGMMLVNLFGPTILKWTIELVKGVL